MHTAFSLKINPHELILSDYSFKPLRYLVVKIFNPAYQQAGTKVLKGPDSYRELKGSQSLGINQTSKMS
jgi:hypothetical protein